MVVDGQDVSLQDVMPTAGGLGFFIFMHGHLLIHLDFSTLCMAQVYKLT
jgi:hypothetical protein